MAADFTLDMMRTGKRQIRAKSFEPTKCWLVRSGCKLPALSWIRHSTQSSRASLLRNVIDLQQCLAAQFRVLKSGGRIVVLDTTPPDKSLFSPFTLFYLRKVVPSLGKFITGNPEDYEYLSVSTRKFLAARKIENAARQKRAFRELSSAGACLAPLPFIGGESHSLNEYT